MNSLLIAIVIRYAELREDRTALFMISLSLADLGSGVIALPISASLCSGATPTVQHMTLYLPKINMISMTFFSIVSLHSQAWVALYKMVSVLKPLRYEQLLSRNRCYGIIVSTWVVGAALASTTLTSSCTWNTDVCTYRVVANNSSFSVLALGLYIVSSVLPGAALVYATARIFLVVVRAHSQVSAQVQSISGGADQSGMVTLKAIRSAKNVLVICFVALALTVPIWVFAIIRHMFFTAQTVSLFSFTAIWLFYCNSFMNSFLYMVLHRSIRQKLKLMFTGVYESCRCGTP